MSELGKTIRVHRTDLGLSQEKLGELVEYGRQNISSIESGSLIPADDLLERIAQQLQMPAEKLIALKVLEKTPPEIHPWLLSELKARLES